MCNHVVGQGDVMWVCLQVAPNTYGMKKLGYVFAA
jgi:hypothetical protein